MVNVWENNDVFRGLFFAMAGFLILAILLIRHWCIRRFRLKAKGTAMATITNIRKSGYNYDDPWVYQPVYEYYAEGQMRKVASRYACNIVVAESGSQVEVFYIPGAPEKIYVPKAQKTNRILIIALIFISTSFIFMGTAVALGLIKS